ncbi:hypothetical protein D3C75_1206590 [compost metagenome]
MQLIEQRLTLGRIGFAHGLGQPLPGLRVVPDLARLLVLVASDRVETQCRVEALGVRERHHLEVAGLITLKLSPPLQGLQF